MRRKPAGKARIRPLGEAAASLDACEVLRASRMAENDSRLKTSVPTARPYDFIVLSVLHLGHTTRSVPLPRGTDSTCPQPLHLK